MVEKIIIENRSRLPIVDAVSHVQQVLNMGRISNDNAQYCYATTFKDGIVVEASRNAKSDRFVVYDEEDTAL